MWRGFVISVIAAVSLQYIDPFGTKKLVLFGVGIPYPGADAWLNLSHLGQFRNRRCVAGVRAGMTCSSSTFLGSEALLDPLDHLRSNRGTWNCLGTARRNAHISQSGCLRILTDQTQCSICRAPAKQHIIPMASAGSR